MPRQEEGVEKMDEQAWQTKSDEILKDIEEWKQMHRKATFVEIKDEMHTRMAGLEAQVLQEATQGLPLGNILKTLDSIIAEHSKNVEIKDEVHTRMAGLEAQVLQEATQGLPSQHEGAGFWSLGKLLPRNPNRVTSDKILKTLNSTIDEHYKDNEYIKGRFKDAVWYFETSEDDNTFIYNFLKFATVILSASTSLYIGLEAVPGTSPGLKILALILTLFVTVFSTLLATFGFQEKGAAYRRYRERH
jgi:hypothetical protein